MRFYLCPKFAKGSPGDEEESDRFFICISLGALGNVTGYADDAPTYLIPESEILSELTFISDPIERNG
jgi:hypothetical protein